MIVKLSEKQINKALDYICKYYNQLVSSCKVAGGNRKMYESINVILDMKDTLKDNGLLDK